MLRDNVTRLDMGKKVKEPGHRIHSALPLVYILGGTDFPLAGEVSCRAVSVSPAGRVLLVLDNAHAWFVSGKIPISFQCSQIQYCCQMEAMLSAHTWKQMDSDFSILLSEVQMRTGLILQYKSPSLLFSICILQGFTSYCQRWYFFE